MEVPLVLVLPRSLVQKEQLGTSTSRLEVLSAIRITQRLCYHR